LTPGGWRDRVECDASEYPAGRADLFEVAGAAGTDRHVLLEAAPGLGVELILEVLGYELDELATSDVAEVDAVPAGHHDAPTK
jgi:hypothetical protein